MPNYRDNLNPTALQCPQNRGGGNAPPPVLPCSPERVARQCRVAALVARPRPHGLGRNNIYRAHCGCLPIQYRASSPASVLGIRRGHKRWSSRRRVKRVKETGVVPAAVPTTALSPFAPGQVVIVRTEGVSRFDRRTIRADDGAVRVDCVPVLGHCRRCRQCKTHSQTWKFEFHHTFVDALGVLGALGVLRALSRGAQTRRDTQRKSAP
jgi:hypothetical protein